MPVQIDELIITATVNPPPERNSESVNAAPAGNGISREEIAEQVLNIIREKKER